MYCVQAPGKGMLSAKYKASPPQMLPGWEEALETMKEGGTRVIQVRRCMYTHTHIYIYSILRLSVR